MATHLIFAEHDTNGLKKTTLNAISAAQKIGGEIYGLILGHEVENVAKDLCQYVKKVHLLDQIDLKYRLAQSYAQAICEVLKNIEVTHVWAAATAAGKDLMPRVAVRLNAAMASDICAVIDEETFERPMWAGDLIGQIKLLSEKKVITVRASEFPQSLKLEKSGEIVKTSVNIEKSFMRYVSFDQVKSERPELSEAKIVVSGGRGVKGPEGFKELIEPLADLLNAAIGASRAVCDAGWVPNDWQVGQTGKVVAPKLYIAIGISGAIQHVAGMKGSKVIVAINKDPEAPIFQVADYGLVADAFKAVPELIERLSSG